MKHHSACYVTLYSSAHTSEKHHGYVVEGVNAIGPGSFRRGLTNATASRTARDRRYLREGLALATITMNKNIFPCTLPS